MFSYPHNQYVGFNFFLTIVFVRWAATCPYVDRRPVSKAFQDIQTYGLPACRTVVREGKRQLILNWE
jgi:hypothetical protein